MANEKNLIPINQRTKSEQREYRSKGGKKSGEVRRQKKKMKETMNMLLSLELDKKSEARAQLSSIGIQEEDLNVQTQILMQQALKAMNGNLASAQFVKEVSDELGIINDEEKERKYKILIPAYDIPPAFINVYRNIKEHKFLEYMLRGGRASLKSSFVSIVIDELLENNPKMCAIVIRRYTNTLRDSVYSQMKWAINKMSETYFELIDDYKDLKSPLEITKVSTGQKIYFRGTDDPRKNQINKTTTRYVHWSYMVRRI